MLFFGLLGCVGFGGWIVWCVVVRLSDENPTAYSGWLAWELIDTHLLERTNQWPRSIADLQAVVPAHQQRGRNLYWHMNDLTNRIAINWDVDVESLRASAKTNASNPLLLTRRDGKPINPVWGKGVEPNYKIEQILALPTGFLRATN